METEMAAKREEIGIELPKLDIRLMEVTVVGDSPLIVHAWSEKAKKEMLGKQMKTAKQAKEAKDPKADFESSLYRLGDGGHGFPSIGFKAAAVTACTSVAGITKVAARQAFHILGEDVDVKGAFDGTSARHNLVRIEGSEPSMREDMVRVGMGTADLRYRGEFADWHAKLLVRYNANVLSESQILNIINVAGFAVGVGEWRPEKDGMSGMFHVATEADMLKLEAAQ
ncbi:hypothetical protein [Sinorhizobium meliloti]|uniref:hypothetical protein n=1 Tax=Rhizobium meliloti TaxID=382 RepID=UPI000FD7EA58|nr:hypothetical protein [Sinorhizobium meliloti]RVK37621.1 hypothetical protein CN163_15935 [Sinorhizobium meliloti]